MKRILFVDDDENVLRGLKLQLRPMRGVWEMFFAQGGEEALRFLETESQIGVVISDLHMPGMHGADFLGKVMAEYPDTVRFVLSGNISGENLVRSANVAHQVIAKPCDPHHLRNVLSRALSLRDRLRECELKDALFEMGTLPSVPVIYWEIMNEINSPEPSIERVGKTIEKDPGMSAKVLQIVNVHSRNQTPISNIRKAAEVLGLENLKSFVLMAEIFTQYGDHPTPEGMALDTLWQHGLTVGLFAKAIAELETDDKSTCDNAYTAGLLHDIGLLILATKLPDEYHKAREFSVRAGVSLQDAERELFGATHGQLGGYLMDLWGLPEQIVNGISYHFYPSGAPEEIYESHEITDFEPLTAVHVANYFAEDQEDQSLAMPPEMDNVYIERLNLSGRIEDWWDICLKIQGA